jgi:hypothetical protein
LTAVKNLAQSAGGQLTGAIFAVNLNGRSREVEVVVRASPEGAANLQPHASDSSSNSNSSSGQQQQHHQLLAWILITFLSVLLLLIILLRFHSILAKYFLKGHS